MSGPLVPADRPMFSRHELLGGLPARRASTLLFAIEGATARLSAGSRINRAGYVGERTAAQREQEFLKALVTGGDLPRPPTIADIERFASEWASLVPDSPDVRAAMARLIGAKYRFRFADVPGLRSALGLDDSAVATSFERLHKAPITSIYAAGLPIPARLGWRVARATARFDRLSPFWIAYFLALTETLGEGIMSLPLALAGLGPLPGVILLILLGAVNLITMGAMTEAVIRNGSIRYGAAYFGRLVSELIGRVPSSVLTVTLALDGVFTVWFYFLGFGSVLSGATGVPIGVWIALLLALNIYVLRHETLDATIASAVVAGVVTLLLAVGITGIALFHVDPAKLAYTNVPVLNGHPIDGALVGLVFGVVLMAFYGHTSAANSAKLLLTLEPSGRSLLWGGLAAMATVIALFCVASVAILGVLGPEPLVDTNGTAITPLAHVLGPSVNVMGTAYVVLAIGIGSLYVTLGMYNQVVELLPRRKGGGWLAGLAATRLGRQIAGFAPVVLVCVALELVVFAGLDDFAGPIGLAGTLTVPLVTGIFPILLVLAARRTGEYVPGRVVGLFGHLLVAAPILGLFVLAVAVHGLLWEGPIERLAAVAVAILCVGLIAWSIRVGSFRPRAVVELRIDRRTERTTLSVTAAGRIVTADHPADATAAVPTASIPRGPWRELRVWLHQVSEDGWSVGIGADVAIDNDGSRRAMRFDPSPDPHVVAIDRGPTSVTITLDPRPQGTG